MTVLEKVLVAANALGSAVGDLVRFGHFGFNLSVRYELAGMTFQSRLEGGVVSMLDKVLVVAGALGSAMDDLTPPGLREPNLPVRRELAGTAFQPRLLGEVW